MPARTWADDTRLNFLRANLPAYEAAQERKATRKFLAILHENYFAHFPQSNENLMTEEKKRVSTWMNNHSGGRGKNNGAMLRATRVSFRELLRGRLDDKRRQKLQATQAYSELYWSAKLKDVILAEWKQKCLDEPDLPKNNYIAYMNLRVRQLYADETDDVKAEVEHYRRALPNETGTSSTLLPDEDELDDNERTRRIAARDVQSAIDNVESILTEIAKDIEEITGLKSHFLVSGPEPKRNGKMVMFTIAAGRMVSNSRSFKEHPMYKTDVHDKFLAFAKGCYTHEQRMQYANVPFPNSFDSPTELPPAKNPAPTSGSVPSASRGSAARKRARKSRSVASDATLNSDSEHDGDSDKDKPESSMLDTAKYTVDEEEEHDEMDIFSPNLPPDRRIEDSKDSGGLTLYKTAEGRWLSEAELNRMANIARNARLMKDIGVEQAKRPFAAKPVGRDDDDNAPEAEDNREFTVSRSRTIPEPRASLPRQSKQNITYTEKKDDGPIGLDSAVESIFVPAPVIVLQAPGDVIEPVSDQPVATGNFIKPTPPQVTSDVVATSSNVTMAKPSVCNVVNTSVPHPDSVPSLTSAIVPPPPSVPPPPPSPPLNKEVISTPLTTNVEPSDFPHADDESMEVDDHAGLAMPMEVDNHASLDVPPPIQSLDLDSLDLSKVPAWLQPPLKHLRKNFRGELEDKILGALVALEMAWQPLEKRIGTVGRPQAVAWWIKNARPIDRVPPCVDLASFPSQVRGWWSTIQPHWRAPVLEDWPLPQEIPAGESWQEARLGGSNGLWLIVLCLFWWRKSAEEEFDKVALAEYSSVAEDVVFVFEAILSSGVSQVSRTPLSGSARMNARASANRRVSLQAEETGGRARSLRSSGAKENVKPSRARRSRA